MSLAGSGVLENWAVGIAAALIRGNDTLLLKGYGKADVEWNVPVPVDAEFEAGTITHPFTAVALLQLRNEGKLSRDDPGRDDAGSGITSSSGNSAPEVVV